MAQGGPEAVSPPKPKMSIGWKVTWSLGALIPISVILGVGVEPGSAADDFLFSFFAAGCLGFPTMLVVMMVWKSMQSPTTGATRVGGPPANLGAVPPTYGMNASPQNPQGPIYGSASSAAPTDTGAGSSKPVRKIRRIIRKKAKSSSSTGSGDSELEIRYGREELIGRGGMADIYIAKDKEDGRKVVWKQAAPNRFNSLREVNERLSEECAILGALSHPRIPGFISDGELRNDKGELVKVMIMEHIEGSSLSDEIGLLSARGNRIDYEDSMEILLELCEALEYMSDQDPPVYHRDLKPANIVSNPDRGAVLIDFGLAKGVDAGQDISVSKGASEGWSPPERRDGVSGPFTDVFSIGQVTWHLLTGERPFHALGDEEREKLEASGSPDWISDLLRMSSLPHMDRIQTISEFRHMLQNEGEMP